MKIGVLTGGGDVPGLNACIKAIVGSAADQGWDVVGFRRGWAGLLYTDPENLATEIEDDGENFRTLERATVRDIDRTGGTILHTSRTNPAKVSEADLPDFLNAGRFEKTKSGKIDCTPHVLRVLEALEIDALIPIGGDDTLSFGARLSQEGFPVAACPKTMDNDVNGTDFCIGFGTAVGRSVELIDALRTPAASHERIAVVELFGRNSGETALISGYVSGADRVLISEVPFDMERLAELVLKDRADSPMNYAMVLVSEGAHEIGEAPMESGEPDAYGHKRLGGIGERIGARLQELTGVGTLNQRLAYLMRAGAPNSLDRMVAANYGQLAVQKLAQGENGLMMAVRDGKYTTVPIETCVSGLKRVHVDDYYDSTEYRPKIRDVLGKALFFC